MRWCWCRTTANGRRNPWGVVRRRMSPANVRPTRALSTLSATMRGQWIAISVLLMPMIPDAQAGLVFQSSTDVLGFASTFQEGNGLPTTDFTLSATAKSSSGRDDFKIFQVGARKLGRSDGLWRRRLWSERITRPRAVWLVDCACNPNPLSRGGDSERIAWPSAQGRHSIHDTIAFPPSLCTLSV